MKVDAIPNATPTHIVMVGCCSRMSHAVMTAVMSESVDACKTAGMGIVFKA